MKNATGLLTLGIALFATPALAEQKLCEALSKSLSELWQYKAACQCGTELSNLEVTLPTGTHLEAVCDLYDSNEKPVDLNKTKISLERYDSSGGYPAIGSIYISGELVLTGTVRIEPSNSGAMWFTPKLLKTPKKSVFTKNFLSSFKIENDVDYKKFGAPGPAHVTCLTADATIMVRGLEVRLIGNDHRGTYPRYIDVLKVSVFKKC